jgi:CTP:phosphocholine cytidylyltransferase-like protein/thiamine kinase-like enzyme
MNIILQRNATGMLTEDQFSILYELLKNSKKQLTQRELSHLLKVSLGKVNSVVSELKSAGLADDSLHISPDGIAALEPYKVKNAVIMAAGMSTRFAPLSYEKPKALLRVKGEILIEREIRQLQEAGISDITIVVGYMKEKLFYLADKFNVKIAVNEDYYRYNNPSSLILVSDMAENCYICSSDDYFTENVFESYVYRSYYAAVFSPGQTDEYCLTEGRNGRISKVTIGGCASWYMIGHVYFSRDFCTKFFRILKEEYNSPETKNELWENLYMRHIDELDLYIRKYDADRIKEFDSLEELRDFDSDYIVNVDSAIFKNIDKILHRRDCDIVDIHPIKTGMTNTSFRFRAGDRQYIYRHPGAGTELYIDRKSEAASMQIAKELGLDETFIYISPEEGWKLSYFVDQARTLDYHNPRDVSGALAMMRKLHGSGRTTKYTFDIWKAIAKFEKSIAQHGRNTFDDFAVMHADIQKLRRLAEGDHFPKCLCHCDCYDPNFLIDPQGKMYLIDWEYSGMADPASDLGTFLACSDYTMDEADEIIARYLQHKPDDRELRHFIAYAAILSYYWFVWAIYQESIGKSVGEYLYIWYKYTKTYSRRAFELYAEEKGSKKR